MLTKKTNIHIRQIIRIINFPFLSPLFSLQSSFWFNHHHRQLVHAKVCRWAGADLTEMTTSSLSLPSQHTNTPCTYTHTHHTHTHSHVRPSPTPYPMSWFCRICSSDSYSITCRALFCRFFMKKWNQRGGRKGRKERKKEGREGMRRKERKYFLNSLGNSSLNRIFLKFLYCRTSQRLCLKYCKSPT